MTSTVKNSPNFATTALNLMLQHQEKAMGPADVVKWLRVNKYPLFYLDLDALPRELVDTSEFLKALAEDQAWLTMQRDHYRELQAIWQERGIPSIMIKTACIPPTFPYTSDNLDILIPWERADEARAIVLELGYIELRNVEEQNKFLFRKFHDTKSECAIHIHRWVGWNINFFEEETFWDRARVAPDDPTITAPSPEDALLINLAHAYYENKRFGLHDIEKIRINWMENDLDWEYLSEVPKRNGWYDGYLLGMLLIAHLDESIMGTTKLTDAQREHWESELRRYPRTYRYYQKEKQRAPDMPFKVSFIYSKLIYYTKIWHDTHDNSWQKLYNTVRTLSWGVRLRSGIRPNPGMVVAVSGPDGSGKTRQAEALCKVLELCEIPHSYYWSRIGCSPLTNFISRIAARVGKGGRNAGNNPGAVEDGLSRNLSGLSGPMQALWAWLMVVDLVGRYTLRVRLPLLRGKFGLGKVVVCDRYALDAAVEINSSLPKGGRAVRLAVGFLKALSPKPRVAYMLDVPAEVAQERHSIPISLDELHRHREGYLKLAAEFGAKIQNGTPNAADLNDKLVFDVVNEYEAGYPTWLNGMFMFNPEQLNPSTPSERK